MAWFTVTTTLRTFKLEAAGIGDAIVTACTLCLAGEIIENVA